MKSKDKAYKSKILLTGASVLLLVGMNACVTEEEVRRQRQEAYQNGYAFDRTVGQAEERERCNNQINSIQKEHDATVNKLESEKNLLYWSGFNSGIFVAAIAFCAGLTLIGSTGAIAYYYGTKSRKVKVDFEQDFKRPPPSVTADV